MFNWLVAAVHCAVYWLEFDLVSQCLYSGLLLLLLVSKIMFHSSWFVNLIIVRRAS